MTKPSPDVLEFLAAGEWSSSHLAWIPRARALTSGRARETVQTGLAALPPGRLRNDALAAFERGDVQVELLPPPTGPSAEMMSIFSPDPDLRLGGRQLVQVTATGTLDVRWVPLWTSLAAACAVARAFDGLVSRSHPSRVSPPARLLERMGAEPAFMLAEHIMVVSSSDERQRARLTTLGMHDLGMPEIELNNVPAYVIRGLGAAMNAIAFRVLSAVLATPLDAVRPVRMPAELALQRAWVDAALGRHGPEVPHAGDDRGTVRLRRGSDPGGNPWLFVDPPLAWKGGRRRWGEAVAAAALGVGH